MMEVYFIEDRQKIIRRVSLSFEQRKSGCELIGLLWGMPLPNPSCRLLRRGRSHCPYGARQRKLIKLWRRLAGEHDYELVPGSHYLVYVASTRRGLRCFQLVLVALRRRSTTRHPQS